MLVAKEYSDLNIPWKETEQKSVKNVCFRALDLGYKILALNVEINQKDLVTKSSKAKKQKTDSITDFPEPPSPDWIADLKEKGVAVYTRLTLTFSNNNFLPQLNNSVSAKKFDILAIIPESTQALQSLLKSSFKADIITFLPSNNTDVKWNRKLYNECVEKFMYFEINYSPAIRDASERRRIISQCYHYKCTGKSKNIFISSGAEKPIDLRSPSDVINLGFVFALNENKSKESVKDVPSKVINAALGRKLGPFRAYVQNLMDCDDPSIVPSSEEETSDMEV